MSDVGSHPGSSSGSVNPSSSSATNVEIEKKDDKAPLWIYVKKIEKLAGGGSYRWQCNICKLYYNGSYTRVRKHLLKEGGVGVAVCSKVTSIQLVHMTKLVKECEEKQKNARARQVPLPSS